MFMGPYRNLVLLAMLSVSASMLYGQRKLTGRPARPNNPNISDTLTNTGKPSAKFDKVADIEDYILESIDRDTTFVDTTLTIYKEYKFNYLRRDRFGLMQFANVGQTYNSLTYNLRNTQAIPLFAAQARHFNYFRKEDIQYYSVPTPFTELYWKTAFEQGQTLDAFFTINTTKQWNFSVAYKGLRSLGNYQNALTSTGNFRFTTNYRTKNERYRMRGHVVYQDLLNEENGGLRDEDIEKFTSGDPEFLDRSLFDMNFENAENILVGRRFHLDHSYEVLRSKDSLQSNKLNINHIIGFEDRYYQFTQGTLAAGYFGQAFNSSINDKVTLEDFYTSIGANYSNRVLGDFYASLGYKDLNYGYNKVVQLEDQLVGNRIKNSFTHFDAAYKKRLKEFYLEAKAGINLSDDFEGSYLDAQVSYTFFDHLNVTGGININSKRPEFNQLLFQSQYINYNWDNQAGFDNVNTQQIFAEIRSDRWVNLFLDVSNIQNYTFFNLEDTVDGVRVVKPRQSEESIQYIRLKAQKEFRYGKFALENTLLFQSSNSADLNVPEFVTRNSLYFTDEVFKKALKFQTGFIFNFFTEYHMNRYDPLLAEFYTQTEQEIGGFPKIKLFFLKRCCGNKKRVLYLHPLNEETSWEAIERSSLTY
jgi:hypothetical protein